MLDEVYVKLAMRTNDGRAKERLLDKIDKVANVDVGSVIEAGLGMAGESGEVLDMIKKWVFQEKPLDLKHLQKELGDLLWYFALMCNSFGFDWGEIKQTNIKKLEARYPNGFSTERSNNREAGDV